MQIAVMSDSHDHIWNLQKALNIIKRQKIGMIIHCGDFVAPFMLHELNRAGVPVHGVFGNNDGDQHMLTRISLAADSNITLYGLCGQVEISGFKVAFTHQKPTAEGLIAVGDFDLVCFGHSHEYEAHKTGAGRLLNPGEIMGKDGHPGFCMVDTQTAVIARVDLE